MEGAGSGGIPPAPSPPTPPQRLLFPRTAANGLVGLVVGTAAQADVVLEALEKASTAELRAGPAGRSALEWIMAKTHLPEGYERVVADYIKRAPDLAYIALITLCDTHGDSGHLWAECDWKLVVLSLMEAGAWGPSVCLQLVKLAVRVLIPKVGVEMLRMLGEERLLTQLRGDDLLSELSVLDRAKRVTNALGPGWMSRARLQRDSRSLNWLWNVGHHDLPLLEFSVQAMDASDVAAQLSEIEWGWHTSFRQDVVELFTALLPVLSCYPELLLKTSRLHESAVYTVCARPCPIDLIRRLAEVNSFAFEIPNTSGSLPFHAAAKWADIATLKVIVSAFPQALCPSRKAVNFVEVLLRRNWRLEELEAFALDHVNGAISTLSQQLWFDLVQTNQVDLIEELRARGAPFVALGGWVLDVKASPRVVCQDGRLLTPEHGYNNAYLMNGKPRNVTFAFLPLDEFIVGFSEHTRIQYYVGGTPGSYGYKSGDTTFQSLYPWRFGHDMCTVRVRSGALQVRKGLEPFVTVVSPVPDLATIPVVGLFKLGVVLGGGLWTRQAHSRLPLAFRASFFVLLLVMRRVLKQRVPIDVNCILAGLLWPDFFLAHV